MDSISNRTLIIVLFIAMLISFGGTLFGMTRLTMITKTKAPTIFEPLINSMATVSATVNLTIIELSAVNWTPSGLNWSSGRVNPDTLGCTINSMGSTGSTNNCTQDPFEGGAGIPVTTGLNLSNIGNTNISLNISSQSIASNFTGGSGAVAQWNVSDALGQLCGAVACICSGTRPTVWNAFATSDTVVCNSTNTLRPIPRNNTLRFDFEFMIPYDAPSGAKSATMIATYAKVS